METGVLLHKTRPYGMRASTLLNWNEWDLSDEWTALTAFRSQPKGSANSNGQCRSTRLGSQVLMSLFDSKGIIREQICLPLCPLVSFFEDIPGNTPGADTAFLRIGRSRQPRIRQVADVD